MSAFFDSQNNLRSGWKFSVFILVLIPIWFATNFALTFTFDAVFGLGDFLHDLALSVLINFLSAAIATLFVARIVDRLPLQAFGIGFHEGWHSNAEAGI